MANDIAHIATQYNIGGANVVPLTENGEGLIPPEKWEDWLDESQTIADLQEMPWANAEGLAVLNGVGDWSTITLSGDNLSTATENLQKVLDLPPEYPWVVKTPQGFKILVRIEGLSSEDLPAREIELDQAGTVCLESSGTWTAMPPTMTSSGDDYRYYHQKPTEPPEVLSPDQIKRGFGKLEAAYAAEDGVGSDDELEKGSSDDEYALSPTVAADITPHSIQWLWDGYFAEGMIHLLDGLPGVGKTTALLDVAAHFSRGQTPDGDRISPKNTLYLSGEDSKELVLGPRYQAADGHPSRLHVFDTEDVGRISFPNTTPVVESIIRKKKINLCIIDPLFSMLSRQYSMNDEQAVREVLSGLQRVAKTTGCAFILVRHPNKKEDLSALNRGSGSVGIIAQARLAFVMGRHPEHRKKRVLAWNKNNISPKSRHRALTFSLDSTGWKTQDGFSSQPIVKWGDSEPLTAEDLFHKSRGRPPTKKKQAKEFLQKRLVEGPVPKTDLDEAADEEDFSLSTMDNAAGEIGVEKRQEGRQWIWSLPSGGCTVESSS